jgi:hypothetical protein
MPVIRLTDKQRDDAGSKVELARRMAKRFRPPLGMSADEWECEVMMVLVETVATCNPNTNFEAYFFMKCRWKKLNLIEKHRRTHAALAFDPECRPQKRHTLDDVLEGVSPRDSDIIRLRLAGGRWPTIGMAYGVSGRTIQRWHDAALRRIRRRVMA